MKKKSIRVSIIVIVLLCLLALVMNRGFIDVYRSHKEIATRSAQVEQARSTLDSLKVQYQQLKNDTMYIEKLAREKLGMAAKNEKIIKFVEKNER